MAASWKNLEENVRAIASLRWAHPCRAEHLHGVDVDGVVRLPNKEIVLIEITTRRDLDKIREDINKLQPLRMILFTTHQLIPRCYIVLEEEPTGSMKSMGADAGIEVISREHFEKEFFDFSSYSRLRSDRPFGSAVDSKTGENDRRQYIPVAFYEKSRTREYNLDRLVRMIQENARVVVLGDYGTGKSRLISELFHELSGRVRETGAFPLAINLRDHWGSTNATEIIAGHLSGLGAGISIDNAVRLLNAGNLVLLLDGFDEIGAQSHDLRIDDRRALRRNALRGVRELILSTRGPVVITGRSHFFDDDGEELLSSLGLGADDRCVVINAPDYFTQAQADEYLRQVGVDASAPEWLPKKPLIFQLIAELPKEDAARVLSRESEAYDFWGMFIYAITRRESRGIKESISPSAVRDILVELAGQSRFSTEFLGRFSPSDINAAYERVMQSLPDQTGAQLLARMCTLGRLEPESPDRQFVDANIADVLRAEHLLKQIASLDDSHTKRPWLQPLRSVGMFHAKSAVDYWDLNQLCFTYLRKNATSRNTKILGEIVSLLTIVNRGDLELPALKLTHSNVPILFCDDKKISGLEIESSEIGLLFLSQSHIQQDNLKIVDSVIDVVSGIAGPSAMPLWVVRSEALAFENSTKNSASIKSSNLPNGQKILLAIIHKIFFQKGAGREESSLYKGGYGPNETKFVDVILRKLTSEGIVASHKGDKGLIYKGESKHRERMSRIKHEVSVSEDPIWIWAGALK